MKEKLKSVAIGAAIAAAGAVLTYLTQYVSGADFGVYTPLVVAVLSVLTNLVRKLASKTEEEKAKLELLRELHAEGSVHMSNTGLELHHFQLDFDNGEEVKFQVYADSENGKIIEDLGKGFRI